MVYSSGERLNDFESRYPGLEAITRKCEPFGIGCKLDEDPMTWPMHVEDDFGGTVIDDAPHARFALSVPFERYREFRETGHWATWSATLGAVECEVKTYESDRRWHASGDREEKKEQSAQRILNDLRLFESDEDEELDPRIRLCMESGDGVFVSVGPCSDEWVAWQNLACVLTLLAVERCRTLRASP